MNSPEFHEYSQQQQAATFTAMPAIDESPPRPSAETHVLSGLQQQNALLAQDNQQLRQELQFLANAVRQLELSQQMSRADASLKSSKREPKQTFSGDKKEFYSFWRQVESFLHSNARYPTDSDKVTFVLSLLQDKPRDWLSAMLKEGIFENDFEGLKEQMHALYAASNEIEVADTQLSSLMFHPSARSSIADHIPLFMTLIMQSSHRKDSEASKIELFLKTLPKELQEQVKNESYHVKRLYYDFQELCEYLKHIENVKRKVYITNERGSDKTGTQSRWQTSGSGSYPGGRSFPRPDLARQTSFGSIKPVHQSQVTSRPAMFGNGAGSHSQVVPMEIGAVGISVNATHRQYCYKNGLCLICHSKDHQARDCPEQVNSHVGTIDNEFDVDAYHVEAFSISSLSPATVRTDSLIVSLDSRYGLIPSLVDTGAKGGCYMRADVASRLDIPLATNVKPISLSSYDGKHVEVSRSESVPIEVKYGLKKFKCTFRIVAQLPSPAILGYRWLKQHGILPDLRNNCLVFLEDVEFKSEDHPMEQLTRDEGIKAILPRGGSGLKRKIPPKASVIVSSSECSNSRNDTQTGSAGSESPSVHVEEQKDPGNVTLSNDIQAILPRGGSGFKKKIPPKASGDLSPVNASQSGPQIPSDREQDICVSTVGINRFWRDAKAEKLKVEAIYVETSSDSLRISSLSQDVPLPKGHDSIPDWCLDYKEAFNENRAQRLPDYNHKFAMDIELVDGAVLPNGRIYSLSKREEQALLKEVQDGLKAGRIRPSKAAGGCPVLFVKKGDGSLRMCVDYRALNKVTKSVKATLPLIKELVERARGAKIYTKLDLKSAFNLLRIREGKEPLSAFVTKQGLFEWTVVPFGLKNAPGHFQAFMQEVLKDLLHRGVIVYIDDILVYGDDPEEQRRIVKEILSRLIEVGMVVGLSKCLFEVPEVDFVGFRLNANGIEISKHKLKPILEFPEP